MKNSIDEDWYLTVAKEYLSKGYVDVSPKKDMKVLCLSKKSPENPQPMKDTGGLYKPIEGCPTSIQYHGTLLNGSIFETTRGMVNGKNVGGTDDPLTFSLCRDDEKVVRGIDIAVADMFPGEVVDLLIHPKYAYGAEGLPPKVFPHTVVHFEVELVSFKASLPKFPSQEAMAQSRKEREEEERKKLEDNPPPTLDERIKECDEKRMIGNEHFKNKDYTEAKKLYDAAFVHIFFTQDDWNSCLSKEDKKLINEKRHILHLNRSICKLKLYELDAALWDCEKALEIDSSNAKGIYRRALVYTELLKKEIKKETENQFWEIEKAEEILFKARHDIKVLLDTDEVTVFKNLSNTINELNKLERDLKKYKKLYIQDQRKLYKDTMMRNLEIENQKLSLKEKKLEEARRRKAQADIEIEAYEDMPELE